MPLWPSDRRVRCAGCGRRIRNRVHLIDIYTHQHWHVVCRNGALTS